MQQHMQTLRQGLRALARMEQAAPTEAFTDSVLDAATQLGTRLRAPSSAGGSAAELSSLLK